MTASPSADRTAALLEVVDAAQRAAGVLAAKHRGDPAGVAELMGSMDDRRLASGSLLLAELSLGLYRAHTGQTMDACISELCLHMESRSEAPDMGTLAHAAWESTAASDTPGPRHAHLWILPDGTGLHAPPGHLTVDDDTGRLACHLCGRWYVSLGAHVRKHGYTADSYRSAVGLLRSTPLVSIALSTSIASRQREQYVSSAAMQVRMAQGHDLARSGELARRARLILDREEGLAERTRRRNAALAAGRTRSTVARERLLAAAVQALAAPDLATYLRTAYSAGDTVDQLGSALGIGPDRLRRELKAAGVIVRPTGHNSAEGKRSRAVASDREAADRLGTDDLIGWLTRRREQGWTITALANAVGHSGPWVRTRLDRHNLPRLLPEQDSHPSDNHATGPHSV